MRRLRGIAYYDRKEVVTLEINVPADVERTSEKPTCPVRRVLLLEDSDEFREVLRDHLVSSNFEVTSVPSGVEGLQEIRKGAFDLIICDMMMPRVGGEMFYWAVTRARPATAKRFIFITGHQNKSAIDFFFRRVNATVLSKPFQLSELDAIMTNLLRKLV